MKKEIHPTWYETQILCACGSVLRSQSARQEIRIDVCSVCHPFFTGTQRIVDTEGRVERFKKKYANLTTASPVKASPTRGPRGRSV